LEATARGVSLSFQDFYLAFGTLFRNWTTFSSLVGQQQEQQQQQSNHGHSKSDASGIGS
jgi:hypothetical protein